MLTTEAGLESPCDFVRLQSNTVVLDTHGPTLAVCVVSARPDAHEPLVGQTTVGILECVGECVVYHSAEKAMLGEESWKS
jgi:hypothetical protein